MTIEDKEFFCLWNDFQIDRDNERRIKKKFLLRSDFGSELLFFVNKYYSEIFEYGLYTNFVIHLTTLLHNGLINTFQVA